MKVKNIPFKSIIDRSKDLYWSVDQSLRLIYANEAFSSALLALTGKIIQQGEIIVLEDQWSDLEKTWKEHYKKAFSGISFEIGEQYHSPITKETIFLRISFLPIPSEEGAIEMVMCHCKDVTTQKLSDEEARKMMDASLDVICTIDVSGNFKKVSGASLHLWGFTLVELQGKPYINLVYEEDIEKTNTAAESVMAGIDTTSFENRYIKKDGTIVPISWSARWDADSQIMYCIARNATEKIQKKEATSVVENRYKTLIQNGSDLIGLMDAKGNYLYVSPTSKTILGIDSQEFIGKSAFNFINPDDKKEVYAQFIEILKGKTIKINPFRFQNKEGNWKWIETIATNMLNNPDIKGIIANSRDVTERVNQDNKLKNSTENLLKAFVEKNKILESIGDAFFTMDRHFTVSYSKKAAEYLLDTPRENIIGKNLYEVFPDGLNADSYEIYKRVLQTGEPVTFEEYFGLWLEINAHPSDEGLSIFFRDITLRKETDQRILKANERFEKVVEATDDSIWDWEIINDVFYRSKGFVKLFGLKTTFILNEKDFWKDNFHPDDLSQIKESLQKALKDKTCTKWEQEYRIIYDEVTTKTVFDRGLIIRNEEGTPIRMVGAITDISYRKKHEEALLALNDSLKKYANELEITNEQLVQFAFIASHDLQEPLRMISSFLNKLERKYAEKLDEKALQYIHFATDGAKRMKQIILDLLEYSRAGKFQEQQEELDLKLILEEYTILRRKMISDSEAIIQTDPLPIIKGYKAPLTQTLHCLLDNAIKYSKKGVTPIIKISFQSKANEWEVGIHDNGIGIDPKFFDKIFIIFQRLHNREEYEGTGIGLSIAKKHIETWGRRIWLISVPNIGSSFYFTLPRQISIKN